MNMMINQYLVSLGTYEELEDYSKSSLDGMAWFFFVFASFASTVVALNMIIAIMSDTYSKVSESYVLYMKRMKLSILIDYIELVQSRHNNEGEFLVIVTKNMQGSEVREWEGTVQAVRHEINDKTDEMKHEFEVRIEMLEEMLHT